MTPTVTSDLKKNKKPQVQALMGKLFKNVWGKSGRKGWDTGFFILLLSFPKGLLGLPLPFPLLFCFLATETEDLETPKGLPRFWTGLSPDPCLLVNCHFVLWQGQLLT